MDPEGSIALLEWRMWLGRQYPSPVKPCWEDVASWWSQNVGTGCAVLGCSLYPTLCDPRDCSLLGSFVHGSSPGKNIGVGCHGPGVFLTPGLNPGLQQCRWILYQVTRDFVLDTKYLIVVPFLFYLPVCSVQSLSRVRLFVTPWIAARQASLSITNSPSLLKLMSIESVMPSSHFILCHPLILPPPIPPSIRVFSNESTLHMRWPKYWSFSFSISPSNEHPGWC